MSHCLPSTTRTILGPALVAQIILLPIVISSASAAPAPAPAISATTGRVVRITTPRGGLTYRWAIPGQVISKGLGSLSYLYKGAKQLRYDNTGEAIKVNGHVVAINLAYKSDTERATLLRRYRKQLVTVMYRAQKAISPAVLKAILQLGQPLIVLDLAFYTGHVVKLLAQLRPLGKRVVGLSLEGAWTRRSDLKELRHFPNLRWLNLKGHNRTDAPKSVGDGQMRYVARLRRLRALELTHTSVEAKGIKRLSKLGLRSLTWYGTIEKSTVAAIAGLRSLEILILGNADTLEADLAPLAALKKLRELRLALILGFTGAVLQKLRRSRDLRILRVHFSSFKDAAVKHLLGFPKLAVLSANDTPLTDRALATLGRLRHLIRLDLGSTKITGSGLRALKNLKRLEALNLNGTRMSRSAITGLARFRRLRWLHLRSVRVVSVKALKRLATLKDLRWLSLEDTRIRRGALKPLSRMKTLRRLVVDLTHLKNAGLEKLQRALPKCKVSEY